MNEDEEKELEQKRVANRPSEAKIEEMRRLQMEKLKSMREKWNEPMISKPIITGKTPKTESRPRQRSFFGFWALKGPPNRYKIILKI